MVLRDDIGVFPKRKMNSWDFGWYGYEQMFKNNSQPKAEKSLIKKKVAKTDLTLDYEERYKSNLTKRYYFPLVEGAKSGLVLIGNRKVNAYTSYVFSEGEVVKVSQYNKDHNWLLADDDYENIVLKGGFHMSWWKESEKIFKTIDKKNRYLNRQYCRISRHLENGNIDKAIAIWRLLHTRSKIWGLVLIAKKIAFSFIKEDRMISLIKTIRKLMRRESGDVKYKRIFLKETNPDGTLKKYRPLGVPSLEWRVIAASYEFLLVNLWKKSWAKNQFACMPKSGVIDAWLAILSKISKGNVTQIIGYDLAKFFDLVYVSNILPMMEGLPPFLTDFFLKMVSSKPDIKKDEQHLENERLEKTLAEREEVREKHYKGKEWIFKPEWEAPYVSFPQGLNTSPIMCCRALQLTGALDHENIVQYVDDGLIINTTESEYTLGELRQNLKTDITGICLSDKKTETIMENGMFLKPLKFLGCSYDGRTFKANTRKGGEWEAENSETRIRSVIQHLFLANTLFDPSKKKNKKHERKAREILINLITEGWNHLIQDSPNPLKIRDGKNKGVLKLKDKATWWDKTLTKIVKLKPDSIEVRSVEMINRLGMTRLLDNTNCYTMLGSYYLMRELESTQQKKVDKVTVKMDKSKNDDLHEIREKVINQARKHFPKDQLVLKSVLNVDTPKKKEIQDKLELILDSITSEKIDKDMESNKSKLLEFLKFRSESSDPKEVEILRERLYGSVNRQPQHKWGYIVEDDEKRKKNRGTVPSEA